MATCVTTYSHLSKRGSTNHLTYTPLATNMSKPRHVSPTIDKTKSSDSWNRGPSLRQFLVEVKDDADELAIFAERFDTQPPKIIFPVYWNAPMQGLDGDYFLNDENVRDMSREFEINARKEWLEMDWNLDERWKCPFPDCMLCTDLPDVEWEDLSGVDLSISDDSTDVEMQKIPIRKHCQKKKKKPTNIVKKRKKSSDVHITRIPKHGPHAPRWFKELQIKPYDPDPPMPRYE